MRQRHVFWKINQNGTIALAAEFLRLHGGLVTSMFPQRVDNQRAMSEYLWHVC